MSSKHLTTAQRNLLANMEGKQCPMKKFDKWLAAVKAGYEHDIAVLLRRKLVTFTRNTDRVIFSLTQAGRDYIANYALLEKLCAQKNKWEKGVSRAAERYSEDLSFLIRRHNAAVAWNNRISAAQKAIA